MAKGFRSGILGMSALLCLNCALSNVPSNNIPITFLGPTLLGSYAGWVNDHTAYSVLGELGIGNIRLNGTTGYKLSDKNRVKFTLEYLLQDIKYPFFSGVSQEWVQQGAFGIGYQQDITQCWNPSFDIDAYVSYAPSKSLSEVSGAYLKNNALKPFTNNRRIAGSIATGINPGVSFDLWQIGRAGLKVNYDYVNYDKHSHPYRDAIGFGGTAFIELLLLDNIELGLASEVRAPFTNYYANLNWVNTYKGRWLLGLYGEYTSGKKSLPNTYNIGININYFVDCAKKEFYGENLKGDNSFRAQAHYPWTIKVVDEQFITWIADPAVYLPQVLAIPDQKTNRCSFGAPKLTGIQINPLATDVTLTIPTAYAFKGKELSYSISVNPSLHDGDSITINPLSGEITITPGGFNINFYIVTVTAANLCGFISTQFFVLIQE